MAAGFRRRAKQTLYSPLARATRSMSAASPFEHEIENAASLAAISASDFSFDLSFHVAKQQPLDRKASSGVAHLFLLRISTVTAVSAER